MTTAADLIRGSLRLIGKLAEGEIPSNETYDDSLTALNELLDAWSVDSLAVYTTQDQVLTWPSGQASRTLGPTGQLVGLRPVRLDEATHFVVDGVSYPIFLLNQEQYRSIAEKASTGAYPTFMYIDMEVPDATVYVYPVPTQDIEMHFVSAQALTQPATILTTITMPPGYMRAFRYNLACALASEFGMEPPGWVVKIANEARGAIERVNDPMLQMSMPTTLPGADARYDIYQG